MIVIHIIRYSFFIYSLYLLNKNQTESNINRVKECANNCGPLAIKILQLIIMGANDILKTNRLNFVFENCNIHDIKLTEKMYFQDFKRSINDDYNIIEVIGSGSIGQVYRAFCKTTNKFVAVKVKHPDVNKNVNETVIALRIVCFILRPINQFHSIFIEYINNIHLQIDYIKEANNTEQLRHNFRDEQVVVVPEIYHYTSNFIIMSYHEGKTYNQVCDATKKIASMYINFIYLTSILIHDFLHADLHYGNWKIIEGSTFGDIKILIYDCGIICTTGNKSLNLQLIENISKGKNTIVNNLLNVIINVEKGSVNKIKKMRPLLEKYLEPDILNEKTTSSECIRKLLRKMVSLRLVKDKNLINILTSISIIGEIPKKSISLFVKYIVYPVGTNSLLYNVYAGILGKLNMFNDLKLFFINYLDQDPQNKVIFDNWLYEEFGHRKAYILIDIIYNLFFPKEN